MELCTIRASSNPLACPLNNVPNNVEFRLRKSLPLNRVPLSPFNRGIVSRTTTNLRGSSYEESSSGSNKYSGEKSDGVVTVEDVYQVDNNVTRDNVPPVDKSAYVETVKAEASGEEPPTDQEVQSFAEFLEKLNIKMDLEDSYYSLILYGGGALVAIWLLSAIVGAIDSIPLFPKLMEVVGLGYSLWFTTRYILFKRNREELGTKIQELKREILGSSND